MEIKKSTKRHPENNKKTNLCWKQCDKVVLRGAVTTSNIDTYIWKKKTKINKHPIQEAEKNKENQYNDSRKNNW